MFPGPLTHGLVVMDGSHRVLSVYFRATVEQQLYDARSSVHASPPECGATALTTMAWAATMSVRHTTCEWAFVNAEPSLMLKPRPETEKSLFLIYIHKDTHTHTHTHTLWVALTSHEHRPSQPLCTRVSSIRGSGSGFVGLRG